MDDAQPSTSPDGSAQGIDQPARKKQKRNKPTLSCEECVERKTKVSACREHRGRKIATLSDVHDNLGRTRLLRLPAVRSHSASLSGMHQAAVDL